MATVGITATGSYVPPWRVPAKAIARHWPAGGRAPGVTTASVAGYDEDVVTMGVEAARAALDAAGLDAAAVDALVFATCSSPYAEHGAGAEAAKPLALRRDTTVVELAGSTRGGVQGLRIACAMVAAGDAERVLVIAADDRRGEPGTALEQSFGAGAVALLVGADDVAVAVEGWASHRSGVATRWRPDGETTVRVFEDARFERQYGVLEPVAAAAAALADRADDIRFVAIGHPDGALARPLRRALKLDDHVDLADDIPRTVGDLGAAAALQSLHEVCARAEVGAGGFVVGVEPGSGADVALLRVVAPVPAAGAAPAATEIDYVDFLQRKGALRGPGLNEPVVPWAATPAAHRDEPFTAELTALVCDACGSMNFPARRICIDCGATAFHPEPMPRTGRVVTYNQQYVVAVSPEPVPVSVGVVRLDGAGGNRGGQVSAMFTDSPAESIVIDAPVELVYRRVGLEYGLVKYGWKFRVTGGER